MRRSVSVSVSVIAGVLLAGCGSDNGDGTLSVSQVFDPARPYGFEGTSPRVTVRDEAGVVLDVAPDQPGTAQAELLSEPLAPGSYAVTAAQHACPSVCMPGAAIMSGHAVISCTRTVDITGGDAVALLVRVKPTGHGSCVIEDA